MQIPNIRGNYLKQCEKVTTQKEVIEFTTYESIPKYPIELIQPMLGKMGEHIPEWAAIAEVNGWAYWDTTFKTTDNGAEAIMQLKWKAAEE